MKSFSGKGGVIPPSLHVGLLGLFWIDEMQQQNCFNFTVLYCTCEMIFATKVIPIVVVDEKSSLYSNEVQKWENVF